MLILGIDAGASKTRVLLGTTECFGLPQLDEPVACTLGPGNYRQIGTEGADRLAREILDRLQIPDPAKVHMVAGFAGAGTPEAEASLRGVLQNSGFTNPCNVVTSDVGLMLHALQNNGIVLISGTGSICMGRTGGREDSTVRAGGWGYRLGDPGSGYHLGIRAIEAATHHYDGMPPFGSGRLYEHVMDHFGLTDLTGLSDILYPEHGGALVQERVAALAGGVIEAAYDGDSVAEALVGDAVDALAGYVQAVHGRLAMDRAEIGLSGGLFNHPLSQDVLVTGLSDHSRLSGLDTSFRSLGGDRSVDGPLIEAIRYNIEVVQQLELP